MIPVDAPAIIPAMNAQTHAINGLIPATIREEAVAAPNVNDPSAVMSGNENILKLMNIPSASSARINPIVTDPISSDIVIYYYCEMMIPTKVLII